MITTSRYSKLIIAGYLVVATSFAAACGSDSGAAESADVLVDTHVSSDRYNDALLPKDLAFVESARLEGLIPAKSALPEGFYIQFAIILCDGLTPTSDHAVQDSVYLKGMYREDPYFLNNDDAEKYMTLIVNTYCPQRLDTLEKSFH